MTFLIVVFLAMGAMKLFEMGKDGNPYGYSYSQFEEELRTHADEKSSVACVHQTKTLKIHYGFIKKAVGSGRCEVACFTESDSILEKKLIEYGRSLQMEDTEERVAESIKEMMEKIEAEEDKIDAPCVKKVFLRSYYANPLSFDTWKPRFFDIKTLLKWVFRKRSVIPAKEEIEKVLKVEKPKFSSDERGVSFTWLGHACVLARLDGVNIITDPVFSSRASFVQFAGPKRHVESPCTVEELPDIDIVVISHDHYDHLDMDAIKRINVKSPKAKWYVPLGVDKLLKEVKVENVKAMSWGDEERLSLDVKTPPLEKSDRSISITCVPAQHWGCRNLVDIFSRLWSGWVVSVDDRTFYYTGDTGFCKKEFLKIGQKFNICLAAIPIGCYEPSEFMRSQHISPREAVAIHEMVNAKKSVGIHWGTYDMGSSEGFLSPGEDLKKAVAERNLREDEFILTPPGVTEQC